MSDSIFKKPYWFILGLTVFGFAFADGFTAANYFKSYYMPFILKNMNPGLYATDLFVNSQSVYHTVFFPAVAFVLRYFDMGILFASLSFIITFINALLVFEIASLLFRNRAAAYLSVLLLFFGKFGLSLTVMGILSAGLFEPTTLAKPFLLFAVYLFLKERYPAACLLTGLLFYLHGLEAFFIAAMFLFFFLLKFKQLPRKKVLYSALLLALPAAPLAWAALSGNFMDSAPAESVRQWLAILRFRSFYHLFPFSWGAGDWLNYSGWFMWAYILLKRNRRPEKHDTVIVFGKAVILLCLLGTVFVELAPVPVFIKLVLWRSTMFMVLFLVIYISDYLVNFPRENWIQLALVAGTAASLFFSSLPSYKLIACFAALNIAYDAYQTPRKALFSALFSLAGIAGIIGFTLFTSETRDIYMFYATFAAFFALLMTKTRPRPAFLIALLFIIASFGVKARFTESAGERQFNKDWIEAQVWARGNTPVRAVFITPPYLEGFRIYSRREVVAENKDGAACVYDIGFSLKWWERMNALGYSDLRHTVLDYAPFCKQNYNNLSEKELVSLGARYNASFAVTERQRELKLKLVHRNSSFNVYSTGL
jgi:hypothetical protein